MKIDEKRKAIEVLLCADSKSDRRIIDLAETPDERDECYGKYEDVFADWDDDALDVLGTDEYWHTATEAAYRLIESSPRLRKEWFGR